MTTETSEVPHLAGCVVLIPVKAFAEGKARLAPTLDRQGRAELSRLMATRVLEAAAPLPVAVVCDDAEVGRWAGENGAMALPEPGRGLNGAVEAGVGRLAALGASEVMVAHADLPMAHGLARLAGFDGVTLVPDRRDDGTNVVCVPAGAGFRFAYGPGSFARHRAEVERLGLALRVVRTPDLAWDVDVPADIPAEFVPPRSALRAVANEQQTHEQPANERRANERRANDVLPVGDLPWQGEISVDVAVPTVALAVGAHPDDVEFGCGATLAKWAAAGCRIHHLILTDGSKGTWAADEDVGALVATRQNEQREAAAILAGAGPGGSPRGSGDGGSASGDVTFLDWVDGELEAGMEQRRQVCRVIRAVRPEVVLGHDPWRRYRLHPDHRNAGWLLTDGVVAARDPKFFPELSEAPHRPRSMLLWEADEANHVENAEGMLRIKVAALLAHRSQYRSTMGIEGEDGSGDEREAFRRTVEAGLAAHGRLVGLSAGEAFRLLSEL